MFSVALMTSSFTSANIILKKAPVKGLSVQIDGVWLRENMKDFDALAGN